MSKLQQSTAIVKIEASNWSSTFSYGVNDYNEATSNIVSRLISEGRFGGDPTDVSLVRAGLEDDTDTDRIEAFAEIAQIEWTLYGFSRGFLRDSLSRLENPSRVLLLWFGKYVRARVAICSTIDDLIKTYREFDLNHLIKDDDDRDFWEDTEQASSDDPAKQEKIPTGEATHVDYPSLDLSAASDDFPPSEPTSVLWGSLAQAMDHFEAHVENRAEKADLKEVQKVDPTVMPWELLPYNFKFSVPKVDYSSGAPLNGETGWSRD